MPSKCWLKQNGPPGTAAPDATVATPQLVRVSSRPMNIYSALTLQCVAKAHSTPPPTVHVVTTLLSEVVEITQLPHPAAVVRHASITEPRTGTKAAPPLT